jgi:uncharacterized membrane protein (UPF0127 family)
MRILFFLIPLFLISSPVVGNFNHVKTCIKSTCFDARIADTPITRAKGLMGEDSLPKDSGMLFIFPELGQPKFWMKNTKIPLDILFINDEDIIVYMVKNAQPCGKNDCPIYKTTRDASKVLEINAGVSKTHGIHVGDAVQYFVEDD